MGDAVFLRNIRLSANVGLDCWHRDKAQPALVSLSLPTDIQLAGETDDVVNTINYGTVYKAIDSGLAGTSYDTLDAFTEAAARIGLEAGGGKTVKATVKLPKVILQAEGDDGGVAMDVEMAAGEDGTMTVQSKVLHVHNLRVACVLGVNDHERTGKQLVALNLDLYGGNLPAKTDYQKDFAPVIKLVEDSSYLTLEALCWAVAKLLILGLAFSTVRVSIEKPNAYGVVDCPGVVMTRSVMDIKP
ncbi:Folic acid synthesis protein fol1 [Madurella mycetomatis]|uniref:dihydroneopterin aldolase n=1 Tax=Madurella mycetomatis TaxID=100816 RepID=A0A175VRK2_9PEZI|nr:Folic acid synthesis protein fol1 [Madurella mycetomatis]